MTSEAFATTAFPDARATKTGQTSFSTTPLASVAR